MAYGLDFAAHEKVINYAEMFGLNVIKVADKSAQRYDGKGNIYLREEAAHLICHEIAHYIVASPARRKLPDYGLHSYTGANFTYVIETGRSNQYFAEEGRAFLYANYLSKAFGLADKFFDDFRLMKFAAYNFPAAQKFLEENNLVADGLITGNTFSGESEFSDDPLAILDGMTDE